MQGQDQSKRRSQGCIRIEKLKGTRQDKKKKEKKNQKDRNKRKEKRPLLSQEPFTPLLLPTFPFLPPSLLSSPT
jgi:hypothetical protein